MSCFLVAVNFTNLLFSKHFDIRSFKIPLYIYTIQCYYFIVFFLDLILLDILFYAHGLIYFIHHFNLFDILSFSTVATTFNKFRACYLISGNLFSIFHSQPGSKILRYYFCIFRKILLQMTREFCCFLLTTSGINIYNFPSRFALYKSIFNLADSLAF